MRLHQAGRNTTVFRGWAMCLLNRFEIVAVPEPPTGVHQAEPEMSQDDSRQFLLLAADAIVAVLHEPDELGLSESEAIEFATRFLDEALAVLGPESRLPDSVMKEPVLSGPQLTRAAGILRRIADQF